MKPVNKLAVPTGNLGDMPPEQLFSLLLETSGFEIRNRFMGRLLTLIDASIPESKQTEALKDLIRQEIGQLDVDIWKMLNQFARDTKVVPENIQSSK